MQAGNDNDKKQDMQKVGGLPNKKNLEHRMKIAELKQICYRPDIIEVLSSFPFSDPAVSNLIADQQLLCCQVHLS